MSVFQLLGNENVVIVGKILEALKDQVIIGMGEVAVEATTRVEVRPVGQIPTPGPDQGHQEVDHLGQEVIAVTGPIHAIQVIATVVTN